MPSYVLAAQEIAPIATTTTTTKIITENDAISPQRNLSLNLSPQYVNVQKYEKQQQQLGQKQARSTSAVFKQQQQQLLATSTADMLANVSNKLLDDGADDAYSERACLLRGSENNNHHHSFTTAAATIATTTTTTTNINNLNNNNNNNRNNYGSTVFVHNNSVVNNSREGVGQTDYLRSTIDDTLSDVAATTIAASVSAAGAQFNHDASTSMQQQQQQQQNTRQNIIATTTTTSNTNNKKSKMSKLGSKNVGLKRVSFGSSKGSMVETLVFETPTPLSEHVEPAFGFETQAAAAIQNQKSQTNHIAYPYKANMDDSGIEIQEESERSIVRVSIYQSIRPQQICTPEYLTRFEDQQQQNDNLDYNNLYIEDIMTANTIPGYDRQQSTDSGWDNPFRPGGDLSREADEIVNLIRGGKPITPTDGQGLLNGTAQHKPEENCNGTATADNVTKTNITQTQSAANGTNAHRTENSKTGADNNGVTSSSQVVSKQVVPGPTSASHVVIDEKKNKKKGCCVIQ